eukprot:7068362-Pyramimonas_sp.AAC.1
MSTGSVSSISTSCCLGKYAAKKRYAIEVDESYVLDIIQERRMGKDYSVSVTVNPIAPGEMSTREVDEVIRNYLEAHCPREDERTNQPQSINKIRRPRSSLTKLLRSVRLSCPGSLSSTAM